MTGKQVLDKSITTNKFFCVAIYSAIFDFFKIVFFFSFLLILKTNVDTFVNDH